MTDISKEAVELLVRAAPFADVYHGIPDMVRMIRAQAARIEDLEAQVAEARNTALREAADYIQRQSDRYWDHYGHQRQMFDRGASIALGEAKDAILALMEEPTND